MCLITCIPTASEGYPTAPTFADSPFTNATGSNRQDEMSTVTAISLGMSISFVLFLFASMYILPFVKLQPARDTRRCQRHSHDHRVVGVMNPTGAVQAGGASGGGGGVGGTGGAANPMDAPQIGGSRIGVAMETAEAMNKRLMEEIVDRALAVRMQSRGHKRARE